MVASKNPPEKGVCQGVICYTPVMPEPYQVGSGFSDKEFEVANWWIVHRVFLRRLGYGLLTAIVAVSWTYVLWSLLDAYVISYPREQRIPSVITDNQRLKARLTTDAPQPIQTSPVASFNTTDNRQDFLTEVTNSNKSWWAEFSYQFKSGEIATPLRKGYILPNGQRYLTEIGWKDKSLITTPELAISDLMWHRVDPKDVERDYTNFAARRLQLQATDVNYVNNLKIGEQTVGQSDFNLRNTSGYGFWSVDLVVLLFRQGTPVGVTQINQAQIKPGEARPISIHWYDNLTGISSTVVQPNVNILDPAAFLTPDKF